ncbi:hypothetical protein OM076_13660 [Solirubrobacter ginsenosidimutans]|uniref:Effector-associated domain-containing protein n=1 Tax=Solirubrobacter ginsenosidimutans TaxID=490573 RepID=A0A9X3MRP9_9ACTN|nr:hypothetical protein [Solirubrobacter ginsenosidimutans]MDA0161319.1 hypothetical protein [Solirubrobacter ginsenosidimutans]
MSLPIPEAEIQALVDAALTTGLGDPGRRKILLGNVNQRFVAGQLPAMAEPRTQVLSDIRRLAGVDRLADGSVPLRDWLEMAVALTAEREESSVFRGILGRLAA